MPSRQRVSSLLTRIAFATRQRELHRHTIISSPILLSVLPTKFQYFFRQMRHRWSGDSYRWRLIFSIDAMFPRQRDERFSSLQASAHLLLFPSVSTDEMGRSSLHALPAHFQHFAESPSRANA